MLRNWFTRWRRPKSLGQRGEAAAARFLRSLGFKIIERGARRRFGEIDIVARHGDTLVFVEVKARAHRRFGGAAAAVTPWKQRRVAQMAVDYLSRRRLAGCPCRFDVVAIELEDGTPRIAVYANATIIAAIAP